MNPDKTSKPKILPSIALRKHVRTLFEGSIDTIAKANEFIPSLPHPVFQDKPPMLNLV